MDLLDKREFEQQRFRNLKTSDWILKTKIFNQCSFESCNFIENDLTDTYFMDCKFMRCQFSLVRLDGCKLQDVVFRDSKIVGLDFSNCNTFLLRMNFHSCKIDTCNFSGLKLQNSSFESCMIINSDFFDADLTGSNFRKAQFTKTIFQNTNLSKTIFLESRGYVINPLENKIKGAYFSLPEATTLLNHLGIIIE